MVHVVVLGTGMIGTTVVRELVSSSSIDQISAVDGMSKNVDKCLETIANPKVVGKCANLQTEEEIFEVIKDADVAIACLPHALSLAATNAAIAAKCHLVDLVGSEYEEKMTLDKKAKDAGIIIVPGAGVAPGLTNLLAAQGIELLDEADEAVMVCGGIPSKPLPPLWYQVVFRLESVMGLYTRPALAAENGKIVTLPPLSGLEKMAFPDPVGECEAVITDAHSVAYTLKDKVKKIYEKTVRYAGHWSKMSMLSELGFLDDDLIDFDGVEISPKKFSEKILEPKMRGKSNEDITVVRVTVKGKKNKKKVTYTWESIDFYDHDREITSMAKMTAVPAVLMAVWISKHKIPKTGVVPIERIMVGQRFNAFIKDLDHRGIEINFNEQVE